MENLTLTKIIETLQEWQDDIKCDLKSDWIEQKDKNEMLIHLVQLNQSIANLESIHKDEDSQVFNSVIPR